MQLKGLLKEFYKENRVLKEENKALKVDNER